MPVTESEVLEAKRLRGAAHTVFDTQKALVQADLDAAGVGTRIKNRLTEEGRHLSDKASETASEHPQAVKAGAAALVAWFVGRPVLGAMIGGIAGLFGFGSDDEDY
ncbi:hypothetical protein [Croceicoccus hydrothermalis]|uniref:hypothetical protein n=1 Tax=Croceicoccus hydrothermalis TaxID=2867964 RepID=UPI001EFAE377|nr:hypothetical protein [Croceicoccus hydrothermalis]